MIRVSVEKYSKPTIWLDTSVFSHAGKINSGRPTSEAHRSRIVSLTSVIKEKIRSARLFCLKGDHEEEVALVPEFAKAIRSAMAQITWEVSLRHRLEIHWQQSY